MNKQSGEVSFRSSPVFSSPLHIVRPTMPALSSFSEQFEAALKTGQVTNNGPWVQEFERRLSDYLGVPTLVFNNGQIALMTMLWASEIASGEVIVPSFTFAASPHAIQMCGGEPVFVDIADDGSMCLDPAMVRAAITERTVAILGVDSYGIACNYTELEAIAREHGLKILFDSAPSFGSRVDGRLVGGFGNAQIFSFHATKAFATMEGGALCSKDEQLMARARALRNFGQVAGGDCPEAGCNGKMTEVAALIGLEQLKTFERAAERRRACAGRISAGLARLPGLRLGQAPAGQEPIWLYLPVVVDEAAFGLNRDQTAAALERENLYVRKYYSPPCHHMGAYASQRDKRLPVTERAAYNVLALPIFNDMTDAECDGIIEAFEIAHASGALPRQKGPVE